MTITKNAVVQGGKIILDAPEFADGVTLSVTASPASVPDIDTEADTQAHKALTSFFDAFREVAESGVLNELPPDFSESYKEQTRLP